MEPLIKHTGIVALLNNTNIDTDQIIPKQFLKKITRQGYGQYLFYDWRYQDDNKTLNPTFELNDPSFKNATILVTGNNFGCGSSREHAPWALLDYGFRIIIATSFADIFYNSCFKNGILPVIIQPSEYQQLVLEIENNRGVEFTVDITQKTITTSQTMIKFELDDFKQQCLLEGLDSISWTLRYQNQILEYEKRQKNITPWL